MTKGRRREEALKKYQAGSRDSGNVWMGLGIGVFVVVFLVSMLVTFITGKMKTEEEKALEEGNASE